jgi:hypothetical protein
MDRRQFFEAFGDVPIIIAKRFLAFSVSVIEERSGFLVLAFCFVSRRVFFEVFYACVGVRIISAERVLVMGQNSFVERLSLRVPALFAIEFRQRVETCDGLAISLRKGTVGL